MNTIELLRINLHVAHDAFSRTVADVTQEMADWIPPGIAHPLGERYAHAVAAEDWLVNGMARGEPPWFASTWAGRTGFDTIDFGASNEQYRAFRADISALREYERAVFASTADYLNSLSDVDMDRVFDMSQMGYGQVPAPAWWSSFIIGHVHDLMGEISILKGCLGVKGYPF
jgi:hypothetical protein